MKLTPEDLQKLETKQLANIIRKLNAGKTPTAREQALLARAATQTPGEVQTPGKPLQSAFASTLDELAQLLGVTRKSLQNWRDPAKRPDLVGKLPTPRADGRHDVAAWSRAMVEHGLARADEDEDLSNVEPRTVTDWKRYREELLCKRLERDIEKDDDKLLVAAELEVPVGQLLAALQAALSQFPAASARFLLGIKDAHEAQRRLQVEIDAVLSQLNLALYIEDVLPGIVAELPGNPEFQPLLEKLLFAGADRSALLQLAESLARETLARLGRLALRGMLSDKQDKPKSPHVEQVSDALTEEEPEKKKPKKKPAKRAVRRKKK